jgi:hypothetical protein
MITNFDPSNLKQLRAAIDAALAPVVKQYGVRLSLGTISYDPTNPKATTRLTMIAVGDANAATDPRAAMLVKAKADFNRYAESFGLKPEQFGSIFKYGRETYKLVGVKPGSPKYCILATNVATGKTFKLPESSVVELQSKEHRTLFGTLKTPTAAGMCSNDNAYDAQFNPIGKCKRPATTTRKDGFGRFARTQPFCEQCAGLMDESRREMEAEARMS